MIAFAFYLFSTILLGSALMVVRAQNPVHAVLFLILCFFNAGALFILLGAELLAMLLIIVYVGAVAVLFLFVVMMLDIVPQRRSFFYTRQNLVTLGKAFLRFLSYGIAFILIFMGITFGVSYVTTFMVSVKPSILYYGVPILFMKPFFDLSIPQATFEIAMGVVVFSFLVTPLIANKLTKTTFIQTARGFFQLMPMSLIVGCIFLFELVILMTHWAISPYSSETITSPMPPVELMTNAEALGLIIYKDYVYAFEVSGLILLVAMIGAIVLTLRRRKNVFRQNIQEQLRRKKEDVLTLKKIPLREGI